MRWWHSRSAHFEETADERFRGTRFFILPPGMVPVPRTSPIQARKRTPWRPKPDGEQVVDRTGGRDWFGAHLRLEPRRHHRPAVYGLTGIVHVATTVGFITIVLLRQEPLPPQVRQPFIIPVLLSLPSASKLFPPSPPRQTPPPPAAAAPRPAPPLVAAAVEIDPPVAPAAVEEPEELKPEPEAGSIEDPGGVDGGSPGGVVGGVVGGQPGGAVQPAQNTAAAPLRLGPGIEPPRKIKHVKPVYPQWSPAGRLRGTVVIEATIGIDGKVHQAKVMRSIAGLDQAALEAVRQWEFEPARVDGVAIPVIMAVTVTFAII
jgi:protein TonB